jgi:catechol 2,3-dioxygenase-like lactoylglutathione lyase family enzyme
MRTLATVVAAALVVLTVPLPAQLLNKEAPVIAGHYHLNVTSVDEHKKFWVDTLGGTAIKIGNVDVVKFPDVYLFLNQQKPSGPARGTALDHIGFSAPNVPAIVTKITAAGYQLTNGREPAPGAATAAASGAQPQGGAIAYVMGPEGAKIEIVTNRDANAPPLKHHHVHYINKQYVEMRNWYVRALDATERTGPNTFTDFFAGADLPGVGYMLNFFRWEGDQGIVHVPTKGRVYDHVGYEVKNLEAFCKALEAKGIKLTRPYRIDPATKIASAMTVDPWGVGIELTEGLRALP